MPGELRRDVPGGRRVYGKDVEDGGCLLLAILFEPLAKHRPGAGLVKDW
jgi:hypothetical protein